MTIAACRGAPPILGDSESMLFVPENRGGLGCGSRQELRDRCQQMRARLAPRPLFHDRRHFEARPSIPDGIVTGTCFYLLLLTHQRKPRPVIPVG